MKTFFEKRKIPKIDFFPKEMLFLHHGSWFHCSFFSFFNAFYLVYQAVFVKCFSNSSTEIFAFIITFFIPFYSSIHLSFAAYLAIRSFASCSCYVFIYYLVIFCIFFWKMHHTKGMKNKKNVNKIQKIKRK